MAILPGFRRAGWPGLLIAGVCFVLPAALISLVLACLYQHYGALPDPRSAGRHAARDRRHHTRRSVETGPYGVSSWWLCALGIIALGALFEGLNPPVVMLSSGAIEIAARNLRRATLVIEPVALWPLFWVFLKLGAIVFGSGFVLLAFLRTDLADKLHWLNEQLDASAAGQITPCPVFTTATFIGYLLAGVPVSMVGTAAVFLPSFGLIALSGPLLRRLRESPVMGAFLDGVNAGAIAWMVEVCYQLGRSALINWFSYMLAAMAVAMVLWRGVNPL